LELARPRIMGILNATPDSFSDGGRFADPVRALDRALEMVDAGADLLDVGGESTRPGARPVPPEEELARILPVIKALKARLPTPISVDTRKAEVARAALDAGADVINDVSALHDAAMGVVVAASGAGLVLMHMRGNPQTMQRAPSYHDVAGEVAAELSAALMRAREAGIAAERIVIDPGIGFAKTAEHNLELLGRLDELASLGRPILLGPSRKAFLGKLLGDVPPERRDVGTAAACVVGLLRGVRIFRVHEPRVVREALTVAEAVRQAERSQT
jgi:dihydropteroate synthase